MGALGAVAGIVQTGASLFGGGGGGTQYVPNYDSMNRVLGEHMGLIEHYTNEQNNLINAQYGVNSALTDAQYKTYAQQLASDYQVQQNSLVNQYLQASTQTQQAQQALDLENLQENYAREAQRVQLNTEYENTITALENDARYRAIIAGNDEENYKIQSNQADRQIQSLIQEKALTDSGFQLDRKELNRQLSGLDLQDKQLLLSQLAQRDQLSEGLAGVGYARADAAGSLAGSKVNINSSLTQLSNQELDRLTNAEKGAELIRAQFGATGRNANDADRILQSQTLDPSSQRNKLQQQSTLGMQKDLSQNSYDTQLEQLKFQEAMLNKGYSLADAQAMLQRQGIGQERAGLGNQAQGISNQQAGAELQFGNNMSQAQASKDSLINNYYNQRTANVLAPEAQAQLTQRQTDQAYNQNAGALDLDQLFAQYQYQLGKNQLSAQQQLQDADLQNYSSYINSQDRTNQENLRNAYLSSVAAQQTGLSSAYAQNYGGAASQAFGLASQYNNAPRVSGGGGSGMNYDAIGKLGSQVYGLLSGGGNNGSSYNTAPFTYSPYSYTNTGFGNYSTPSFGGGTISSSLFG